MPEEQRVLKIDKRVVYGKNRDVLEPGKVYNLPVKRLDGSVIKRVESRGAGKVMTKAEYDQSSTEKEAAKNKSSEVKGDK